MKSKFTVSILFLFSLIYSLTSCKEKTDHIPLLGDPYLYNVRDSLFYSDSIGWDSYIILDKNSYVQVIDKKSYHDRLDIYFKKGGIDSLKGYDILRGGSGATIIWNDFFLQPRFF